MKNKILIPLLIVSVFAAIFSFKYGMKGQQSAENRRILVVETIIKTIRNAHFSPRDINDTFSVNVYDKVLNRFDYEKIFFTQKEVNQLERYKYKIDDEIRMGSVEFFDSVEAIYVRCTNRAENYYSDILSQPFTYNGNEEIELNTDKVKYAADEKELVERWKLILKYRALSKFIDLKNDQEKKYKDSASSKLKTDAQLDSIAREDVKKSYQRYFKRIHKWKEEERFAYCVDAITTSEDPHTEYFPPKQKKGFDELMSGSFFGIGAQLKSENDKIMITAIVTGSPSWKQGELKAGDEIIKVAQNEAPPVDIAGYDIDDVVKLIRGDKNTIVKLTVKKVDGSVKVIPITRGVVQLEETFAKSAIIKNKNGNIGYIFLPEFYADFNHTSGRRCAVDIEKEVNKLKDEGVSGIILDLRSNTGGSLGDVVEMAGLFVGRNAVVQVKNNHSAPSTLKALNIDSAIYTGPLVIMVNENSASASEILAAAMQDYKRAVIVGSTTYGKGTVQKMVSLDNEVDPLTRMQLQNDTLYPDGSMGSIKLTMEKFYRVNGGSTQLKGVTPDIFLPDQNEFEDEDMGERHNKSALPWDEIPPASYQPVDRIGNLERLAELSKERVKGNATFKVIEENAAYIKRKKDDNVVSLNETKYKKEQEEVNVMSKKIEELQKKAENLEMTNINADLININMDSTTIKKNADWLKNLSKDIYLSETANIINDMNSQRQLGSKVRRKNSN